MQIIFEGTQMYVYQLKFFRYYYIIKKYVVFVRVVGRLKDYIKTKVCKYKMK